MAEEQKLLEQTLQAAVDLTERLDIAHDDAVTLARALNSAIGFIRRPSPGRAEIRREALEEAARVAERAIAAGERVRDQMAPQSPIDGLENSLHAIVITTARGIARNIRALLPPPGGEGSGAQGDE